MRHPRHRAALSSTFAMLGLLVALGASSTAIAQLPARQDIRVASRHEVNGKPHRRRRAQNKEGGRAGKLQRRLRKETTKRSVGKALALNPASASASQPNTLFKATHLSDFWVSHSASGALSEVPDPAGSGESVFQMTVGDQDVYPVTPTENPRAELISPPIIKPGDEFWSNSKFYLPSNFPSSVPGWLTVLEGPYGRPFNGTPPWHIEVTGEHIQWSRNGTYNWDVPWQMPLVKNSWVSVMVHEKFATNGWIEMWVNGQQVNFFGSGTYNPNNVSPTQRLEMQTMDASNDGGPNSMYLQSYRKVGMFSSVTLDEGPLTIGTTRSSVEG